MDLPNKKYHIIYADPPWHYSDSQKRNGMGARGHYRLLKTPDICKIPVRDISEDDSMLFIWGTWPCLPDCLSVIDAWGFSYKTIGFLWVKTKKHDQHTPTARGTGFYTRPNTEFCLIGRRGRRIVSDCAVSSVVMTPIARHSKKPPIVRKNIVRLCGDVSRIELFARPENMLIDVEYYDGWDFWGNEV
jgi:N6-adenosine-specific RNA methylase IME4